MEKKESPKKAMDFQHPGWPRATPPRYQGYHVLNTSLENVLMKTKGKDILKKPAPIRASSSELNQRRYCRYHRSAGYDTDDCRDLKGEIESLIRRGHLKEFLARPPGGGEPPQPQDWVELPPLPQPGRGEIHMIVEGSQYLEGSRKQRRKLSREAHNSNQDGQSASIYHYAIKFPTLHGVGVVRRSQLVTRSCNINFPRVGVDTLRVDTEISSVDELDEGMEEDLGLVDPRSAVGERKAEPVEELEQIKVDPN
ncbi:Uncharacterized protein Adt_04994 [Abeliophyllum distichum]|uniref:Uncharacterized protein n=1 Tax=Abeliophyllum distichum TaxID=126358 RepID=A0ABD1V2V7_9LAMI